MLGLIVVGLVGFLVVAGGMPFVLWALCLETLEKRAAAVRPATSARPSLAPRAAASLASAAA